MSIWKIMTGSVIGLTLEKVRNDEDEASMMTKEAKSIISKAKRRLNREKKKADAEIEKTNLIVGGNYKLKLDTLATIGSHVKETQELFLKKKKAFEAIASKKGIAEPSNPSKTTDSISSVSALAILPLPIFNNKKENAKKYLEDAREYSDKVDKQISKIINQTAKLKVIYSKLSDEKALLESLLVDLDLIYPELAKIVNRDNHTQVEAKKALFLGVALETYVESINCNLLSKGNKLSSEYTANISKLKDISSKIKEIKQ